MIKRCEKLYQDLLDELRHCREKDLPFLSETEYCFHLAEKYHRIIRQELAGYDFLNQEEEIHFFKVIKPKFVAETEYASLLNFAGNFSPPDSFIEDLAQFWFRQIERLGKFKEKHKEFYTYYLAGHTNLDAVYFTRLSPEDENYAFDKTRSNYDLLAGQLLARERYAIYAIEQLHVLKVKKQN